MSNRDESDEDLIRAWRHGDRAAGGRLLARLARPLSAIARAITGDSALAEEATQDAYLRIARAIGRFREGARVRPWAYAIARNAAWDQLRARRPEGPLNVEPELADSPDGPMLRRERAAEIAREIDGLPPALREAIVLRYGLGLKAAEVARVLGIEPGAAWTRLSRARTRLRRRLADDDGTD